jgi:hypothetical protein
MPSKLFIVVITAWLGSASVTAASGNRWRLIRIPDPVARDTAVTSLEAAAARLLDPDCVKVLTDFQTTNGGTPAGQLAAWGIDIQTYMTWVTFMDDSRHQLCEKGGLFFTSPGSRVVRVCAAQLKLIRHHSPGYLAALFIHEILHTLGLGESPPSSEEITRHVMLRCSPAARRGRPGGVATHDASPVLPSPPQRGLAIQQRR